MEDRISSFWQAEDIPYYARLANHTNRCYVLGNSKEQEAKRLTILEGKLAGDPELNESYIEFLNEYLENCEMERVTDDKNPQHVYYLPHHLIVKDSNSTTRFCVVFDASAKSSTNISLNKMLQVGATIQLDLISLLLSFQLYTFVLATDIKQVYRRILLDKIHQDFQRIVWKSNPQNL